MRPRSANEWRSFWHHGGEEQLEALLLDVWPLRDVSDAVRRPQAARVALLLGSNAPERALAAELGRIRGELGVEPDAAADGAAAARVSTWFRSQA